MRTPLSPALLLLLLLLCGPVLLRSASPRCPPLMLQLLRAPPAPLRAAATTALSIAPHGSLQNGSRWALSFDMTSLSGSQEVSLAELRVRPHALSLPMSHDVAVDIYHSPRPPSRGTKELFLGTVAGGPSSHQAGWAVFNITSMLRAWLHQDAAPDPTAAPVTVPPGTSHPDPQETAVPRELADSVLLLVFSKDKAPGEHSLLRTVESSKHVMHDGGPRDVGSRRHRRTRKERQRIRVSDAPAASPGDEARSLCRRVDMTVDFEQTGWGSWIVYPKKYNAYRCEGLCPSPVDESFKPTNHAYMQSLLQLYKPSQVPCPACSPIRMSPLSMLYYEKGEIVVRHHEDMIIEECGCN
ncbi:nodal homolog [Numida meleagris]|uniref:nodal homolog n=1 Tax=Numida meleagris TaxID=8996 RepID=UPI000B3DFCC2|nr:nodal homolog [Numida meleagris]